MKITLKEITIKELTQGYLDQNEHGISSMDGTLNIRPAYQREFIYKEKQRNAVIDTITKGYPLNIMYWVKNGDNSYEILDGQQRTISICEYVMNNFSVGFRGFVNLSEDEKNNILDYKIMVYVCEGNDKEKLEWFRTINIAGEKLTNQELRNATYTGQWLSDAKQDFSKTNCRAYGLASKYVKGSPIRQDFLETALKWISLRDGIEIEDYMSKNQHSKDAHELWDYFREVIEWVERTFEYRKEMKGVDWGFAYINNRIEGSKEDIEKKVFELMLDEDVTKKSGIYLFLTTGEEKYLNIRAFTDKIKRVVYTKQNGICIKCNKHFELNEMEADHITPWSKGGKTNEENCQMLCVDCNRIKSNK